MPIPSTWSFFKGEEVHVFEPFRCEYTGPLLPKSCHGTISTLQTVQSTSCEVAFGLEVFSLPTILLQKHFGNMDIVFIPSIDGLGLVMESDASHSSASMLLNDATVQRLEQQAKEESLTHSLNNELFSSTVIEPVQSFALNSVYKALPSTNISNISSSVATMIQLVPSQNFPSPESLQDESLQEFHTRRSPWIDDSCVSGLAVNIRYNIMTAGDEWLDYNVVRNTESLHFLHDSTYSGLDSYYHFRTGYIPTYTEVQAAAIEMHNVKRCANILYEKVVEADAEEYKSQLRSLLLLDSLLPDKWILNPIWHFSLHDLEFYIQIHHGPYTNENNQLIHLALSGGRLQVRMSLNRKDKRKSKFVEIHLEDICNIPAGGVHTKKVSQKAYDARGLYLVADANNVKLHHYVGKLVCRICDMTHNDNGNVLCGNGLYFVQRVNLYPIPGKVSYEEEVMVNERPFAIDYSFLLLVHLSATLNAAGNWKMYDIRTEFRGWTLPADEPNGQENSHVAKWRKAEITASVHGLAERIERAQTGRGQTPPPPLQPGPVDWESVSLI
ncbi:hypothetical protein GYMLUDRAFT_248297 [Collybiopsis luxurians FD-317 M1]|uniref:Uncharacterized protein n=1 Tax=Collybiopsis luxurians FD-317 M1 TaxID=944289 RepID=A0A0D0CL71_9AGAR|nr:hypothetical protein GYMLUDRAFT_248297 [Collybiopsis luxurians FD-317 M1]